MRDCSANLRLSFSSPFRCLQLLVQTVPDLFSASWSYFHFFSAAGEVVMIREIANSFPRFCERFTT